MQLKQQNTEIITVELPRDTKGGAGHGSLIYIGAHDVSDARRAVEIALESFAKYFGDVYSNDDRSPSSSNIQHVLVIV